MTKHQVQLLSSRKSDHWQTPPDFYKKLDQEFNFDFDPCPFKHDINKWDGLKIDWKKRNFVNPPYSNVKIWIEKALKEIEKNNAEVCVFLVNANTDTKWFHDYIYQKHEIRFIKGRLKFINSSVKKNSPNMRPSMLIILKNIIMPLPKPKSSESRKDFMQRCMSNSVSVKEFPNTDQRLAVCSAQYRDNYEKINLKSYNDYPQSAVNNAKSAVKWAEKNGWGSCLEATGKKRASQIANKQKISRDTIARMASFKRHQQHKDTPYGEGCGKLAWNAWGGSSGIEWAIRKLKEIDKK